jgi:hypothetical protein
MIHILITATTMHTWHQGHLILHYFEYHFANGQFLDLVIISSHLADLVTNTVHNYHLFTLKDCLVVNFLTILD